MIGPPTDPAYCWFEIGTLRPSTGSSALKRSSRKLARNEPASRFVPDLVTTFTCTPCERPCVASNRFEMNWNSAIISWLKGGWPPPPRLLVTCMPSRFVWYSRTSPPLRSGSGDVGVGRRGPAARREQRQRHPVAAVHRQLLHLLRIDVAAEARGRDVEQRRFGGHRDRLLHRRRRHLQVDGRGLADQQLQPGRVTVVKPCSSAETV